MQFYKSDPSFLNACESYANNLNHVCKKLFYDEICSFRHSKFNSKNKECLFLLFSFWITLNSFSMFSYIFFGYEKQVRQTFKTYF